MKKLLCGIGKILLLACALLPFSMEAYATPTYEYANYRIIGGVLVRVSGPDFDEKIVRAGGIELLDAGGDALALIYCVEPEDVLQHSDTYTRELIAGDMPNDVAAVIQNGIDEAVIQATIWALLGSLVEFVDDAARQALLGEYLENVLTGLWVPRPGTLTALLIPGNNVNQTAFEHGVGPTFSGQPVSAPGTLGLVVAGMAGIAIVRRRRPAEQQALAA